jgi:hypothetical protein
MDSDHFVPRAEILWRRKLAVTVRATSVGSGMYIVSNSRRLAINHGFRPFSPRIWRPLLGFTCKIRGVSAF